MALLYRYLRGYWPLVALALVLASCVPTPKPAPVVVAPAPLEYTCPQLDVLLAATALVHQLGVATRNVEDFARAGVRIVNPWDEPA